MIILDLLSDFTTGYSSQLIVARDMVFTTKNNMLEGPLPAAAYISNATTASTATEELKKKKTRSGGIPNTEEGPSQAPTSIFKEITCVIIF